MQAGGKNRLFLCIGFPRFSKPIEQASSRQCLVLQNNQLDGTYLALLHHLSNHQAPEPEPIMMEDVHILVEDAEVEVGEEEEVVEEVIEEEREEAEQQKQHYKPYQLTHNYRNQLEQFEVDYVRWEENQYHIHHQHFKEKMAEQHERALGLVLDQQHEQYEPFENNIIIDNALPNDNIIINNDNAVAEGKEEDNADEFQ